MKPALLLLSALLIPTAVFPSGPDPASPCSSPNASEFDFWVGEWTASWEDQDGKTVIGSNSVTKIMNGCVIQEDFLDGNSGFQGMSNSVYNPARGKWMQTWVDNQGNYLDFSGTFSDGKMILSRKAEKDVSEFLQRMVWYNITEKEFDWNWERSDDEGKSWKTLWKIHYKRN